jgi:hypothetical protein
VQSSQQSADQFVSIRADGCGLARCKGLLYAECGAEQWDSSVSVMSIFCSVVPVNGMSAK